MSFFNGRMNRLAGSRFEGVKKNSIVEQVQSTNECDVQYLNRALEKYRAGQGAALARMRLWLRLFYLSMLAIVLLAVLAFAVRLATGAYWLPAILAGCMLPVFLFICLSISKWRQWESRVELWGSFMRPMEENLYNACATESGKQ